jgi:AcrR family transcriptional regulator
MAKSAAQTRQRILDASYDLFWRHGFVRVSVDDIAERANVTKRTVYQHFRSKDDVMAVVLAHSSALAVDRLRRIGDKLPANSDVMIDSLFAHLAEWAAEPRWSGAGFTRVVAELADLPGHPARTIARRHKAMVESWIGEMLARANVLSPAERAREIALLIEGAMSLMLIHGDRSYAQAAAQAAKRLLMPRKRPAE